MKRVALLLLPAVWGLTGCLPSAWVREQHKPPAVQLEQTAAPTVTAEAVDESNALDKARILREEMEHDLAKMHGPARDSEAP